MGDAKDAANMSMRERFPRTGARHPDLPDWPDLRDWPDLPDLPDWDEPFDLGSPLSEAVAIHPIDRRIARPVSWLGDVGMTTGRWREIAAC